MTQLNYGPSDVKGREFFEAPDALWVCVNMGNKEVYGKIASVDVMGEAAQGRPFALHHPYMITQQGAVYLPALTKTIEPWFITRCEIISMLHYKVAMEFDAKTKELFSAIILATSMPEMPKQGFSKV